MTHLLAFLISAVYIGLRSYQSLNVVDMRFLAIWPTSLFLAAAEVHLIVLMVKSGGGWIFVPIGLGAAAGCTVSMKLRQIRHGAGNVSGAGYNRGLSDPQTQRTEEN